MSFNLKIKKAQIDTQYEMDYQRTFDQYIRMLMTELDNTGALPTNDALANLNGIDNLSQYGINSFDDLRNVIEQQKEVTEQKQQMEQNMGINELPPTVSANINNKRIRKMIKPFNLKKAQIANPGMSDTLVDPELVGDELDMRQETLTERRFNTHSDLNNELLRIASNKDAYGIAWNQILSENPQNPENAQSALKNYFADMGNKTAEQLLADAKVIYDFIYEEEISEIPANYKEINSYVNEISDTIKKIAKKYAIKKAFNLVKTAQHKTLENAIMWGPSEKRMVDPFSRQPVSDWSIVERNKGFGLVVGDVWDIDYETVWRENIMDKYSRPYRNKDGEWVGGYIQKRFEVDKNIPATSNMQLKPGQRRRPILSEYGNTESRLQEARSKGEVVGANDTSKPFNWKEASSKKKS
jgi:hypothetical protein